MMTDEDLAIIAEYVSHEIEARTASARVVFEMVVEAVSDTAGRDTRLDFRDALRDAADNIRQRSKTKGDVHGIMAHELEVYARQIEGDEHV